MGWMVAPEGKVANWSEGSQEGAWALGSDPGQIPVGAYHPRDPGEALTVLGLSVVKMG